MTRGGEQQTTAPPQRRDGERVATMRAMRASGRSSPWATGAIFVFACIGLASAVAGAALTLEEWGKRPVRTAEIEGVRLTLDRTVWVEDQMDHGQGRYPMPASMMPDLPPHDVQRLSADLIVQNRSAVPQRFRAREVALVADERERAPAVYWTVRDIVLAPGQTLNTVIQYDLPIETEHEELRLVWTRGERRIYMPVPHPPDHHANLLEPEEDWPATVDALPAGDAENGRRLFADTLGCVACHGQIEQPGSNLVGPHLTTLAAAVAERAPEKPLAQFIYESILEPDASLAPRCANDQPCASPSMMPEYRGLLSSRDMADLIAFLTAAQADQAAVSTKPENAS